MLFTYRKLDDLLKRKGLSYNKLMKLEVITDYTAKTLRKGGSVQIEHLAKICRYLDVPIEDVVEVIRD